jgi:release factor glutamine methyltransferase
MTDTLAQSTASVESALAHASRRLAAAGVAEPRRDARLLMAAALDCDLGSLLGRPAQPLDAGARAAFAAMVDARLARKPVSRILGEREFWSLPFAVDASTLDPRPDSEAVVEAALARLPERAAAWRLLDLGTGSGCPLVALLSERPNAWGVGVDRSVDAVRMARANADWLGLGRRAVFLAGDWTAALDGRFDAVVANPPYVAEGEMAELAPEVAWHDPASALCAGRDGLDAYRAIAPRLPGLLHEGGFVALEVGHGQAGAVTQLLRQAGLRPLDPVCDLTGIARCVCATAGEYAPGNTKNRLE